jgi:hypothetical protein
MRAGQAGLGPFGYLAATALRLSARTLPLPFVAKSTRRLLKNDVEAQSNSGNAQKQACIEG